MGEAAGAAEATDDGEAAAAIAVPLNHWDCAILAEKFDQEGYLVLEDALQRSEPGIDLVQLEDMWLQALSNFQEITALISEKHLEFGIGVKQGFKEIVQRHPQRFEMPYHMQLRAFDQLLDYILSARSGLLEIVKSILQSEEVKIVNRSCVLSLPGCEDQAWHSDGPHVSCGM